jgi:3-hydroxyacyl-[acyl-carrier-protein] dehydratase
MMDHHEILSLLPHRYPILLVDRVLELVAGKKLVGIKNVTFNEPHFNGHFPGHPVMPGFLILESLAQASALLAYKSEGLDPKSRVAYLMAVDKGKFRKPVVPGDQLRLEVEVLRHRGSTWKTKGAALVEGVTVAEGEFLATVVERPGAAAAAQG